MRKQIITCFKIITTLMEIIQAVISCHLLTRLRRKKGAVAKESESRSYGVVVNSFYELEKV